MKRVFLFLVTNLAVILAISLIARVLGVDRWLVGHNLNLTMLLGFSLVVGFTGSFISLAMSKWMAIHAYDIHVIEQPENQTERWLVEQVTELTQKAGIPMPTVGIYESPEVNAFATGPSRRSALVAVSSALMDRMSEQEIRGVLAHEVSHVTNGDMVTMALLQGILNTFVVFLSRVIGFAVDQAMRRDDDERESRGVGLGYYIASFVCEIVLGLIASMIAMAFSRHREFRADAMATRLANTSSMIGALKRLKQISEGESIIDDRSPALSAFKINNRATHLFASHPPLEERIAALEKLL